MLDNEKLLKALSEDKFFSRISEKMRERYARHFTECKFTLGDVVLKQNEEPDGYYIILNGKARAVDSEKNLTLTQYKKGESFGYHSIVLNEKMPFSLRSSGKLTLAKLETPHFHDLLEKHHVLEKKLIKETGYFKNLLLLKNIEVFEEIKLDVLQGIVESVDKVKLQAGDYLFKKGDAGDAAYVLLSGKIAVVDEDINKVMYLPRVGDIIGETSLVRDEPRNASIKARKDSVLFKFTRDIFAELLPKIQAKVELLVEARAKKRKAFTEDENIIKSTEKEPEYNTQTFKYKSGWISHNFKCITVNDQSIASMACVNMLVTHYGLKLPEQWNNWGRWLLKSNKIENIYDISHRLESADLLTRLVKIKKNQLKEINFPAIINDKDDTPVVLLNIDFANSRVLIAHPINGIKTITLIDLETFWNGKILLAFPFPEFGKESKSMLNFISRFYPLLKPYKFLIIWSLILASLISLLALVPPKLIETIVDKVIVFQDAHLLKLVIVGLILISAFSLFATALKNLIQITIMQKLSTLIQTRFYNHLIHIPFDRFTKYEVGEYTTRLNEISSLVGIMFSVGFSMLLQLFTTVIFFIYLLTQNRELTAIGLIFIVILFVMIFIAGPKMRKNDKQVFAANTKNESFIIQLVSGIQTVKSLANEKNFFSEGMTKLASLVNNESKGARYSNLITNTSVIIAQLANITILVFGAMAVLDGEMTVGSFLAFSAIYGLLMAPIQELVMSLNELQAMRISFDRINDILVMPIEKTSQNFELTQVKGNIQCEGLSFRFDGSSKDTITDINLDIYSGQKVAFVGRSGSGKSTLINLLLGFYQATSGRIYIDGNDISSINPSSLRKHIGVVEQQPYLFDGTIKENICKADPDLSFEQITQASVVAGVKSFVETLPMNYDTRVGEGGIGLSGGQRQRIAIARAIARNPEILILDEATSALDSESESLIQKNLDETMKGRTTLIIAHRLSTIINADLIVVMDEGRIVESGSHSELIAKKGIYYYLVTASKAA